MRLTEEELLDAVRDERPSIDDEFAAMLDERAARGFPRRRPSRWSALADRVRAVPPRRLIAPAGAVATLLVVVGVSISALGGFGSESGSTSSAPVATSSKASGSGGGGGGNVGTALSGPKPAQAPTAPPTPDGAEFKLRGAGAQAYPAIRAPVGTRAQRKVASTADLTLSTDPGKVRDVAGQVTEVVRRYNGLVISSEITSGKGGPPQPIPLQETVPINPSLGAEFQLRIPAAKLEPALDDLSGLGLVVSRTEGSQDITARFNVARERIASLTSERDVLIAQLAKATTPEAIHAIKHRLAIVRHELNGTQGRLSQLHERVAMVPVHLSVEARGGASGGGGGFGLDDAVHDAGRVLTVATGVLLISLAVLVPLTLIAIVAWLVFRSVNRWRRERALSESF
jgi:hypothetical protein